MRVYLLEDEGRAYFEPFALTRPVGEILFGCETLRARLVRVLGASEVAYAGPEQLIGFTEPGAPEVVSLDDLVVPCLVISSRFVIEGPIEGLVSGSNEESNEESVGGGAEHSVPEASPSAALLSPDGRRVGWQITSLDDLPVGWQEIGGSDRHANALPSRNVSGHLLESIWQLMAQNEEQIATDLAGDPSDFDLPGSGSVHIDVYGTHSVQIGSGVVVGPQVVFDARKGPIRIESGVVIEPLTVVAGPCFIGAGSTLLGGVIRGSSIGPECKIRGEVANTVVLGFSNKAHDGYLGHAVVGRWVNLGAMTTNSDLKNNYSPVRVDLGKGSVDTGERKVGVFLGDHVKTGIGTLLGTGTVVGAGTNVLAGPGAVPNIAPFMWGAWAPGKSGDAPLTPVRYDLERFLATARIAMGRRGNSLPEGMEGVLRRAWQATDGGGV